MTGLTFAVESAVDPSVQVYVHRPQDAEVEDAIQRGFITYVQGSRMSGKSSLLLRMRQRCEERQAVGVVIDLSSVRAAEPENLLEAVQMMVRSIGRRAGLISNLDCLDDTLQLPSDLFLRCLVEVSSRRELPADREPNLVIMFDELDTLALASWGAPFFAMLRDIAMQAPHDSVLGGSRIVFAGVRPIKYLVDDPVSAATVSADQTVWLDDFPETNASAKALAEGFGFDHDENAVRLAQKALEFTGGYPQACIWLCRHIVADNIQAHIAAEDILDRLIRIADRERGSAPFLGFPADYLHSFARTPPTIAGDPPTIVQEALWTYHDLLDGKRPQFTVEATAHLLLRWAGLARKDDDNQLRTRAPLTERFYTHDWARDISRRVVSLTGPEPELESAAVRRRRKRTRLPTVSVLTTGGTIGMVEDESGNVRAENRTRPRREFVDAVRDIANARFQPVFEDPRDSANVVPEDWRRIALAVHEQVRDPSVAGVVVAHGTDTLAYTASAVAYALGKNLTKPVVFTGSQATLKVHHGDAVINLQRACKLAADAGGRLPEVVVCFGDTVLRACQAQKRDDRRFDAFESPLSPPLAILTEEIEYNSRVIQAHHDPPPPIDIRADFDSHILSIAQVPGLRPSLYEPVLASERVSGIIVQSLGAGNLPTQKDYSLVSFIERAVAMDIPVVLGSLYPVLSSNPSKYAPAQEAHKAGALPAFNVTLPALVTKFAWILGRLLDDNAKRDHVSGSRRDFVQSWINTNLVSEIATDNEDLTIARHEG